MRKASLEKAKKIFWKNQRMFQKNFMKFYDWKTKKNYLRLKKGMSTCLQTD